MNSNPPKKREKEEQTETRRDASRRRALGACPRRPGLWRERRGAVRPGQWRMAKSRRHYAARRNTAKTDV